MDSGIIIPEGYPFAGCTLDEIISPQQVQKRVNEIGCDISEKYREKVPIIIGVLNGAFIFMADLIRNLDIEFEVDFIKIDSYGDATQSTGTVRLLKDISADITNRHVIIVEDIVDTGLSLKFLKHRMEDASPKSICFASFLYKPQAANQDIEIDWIGFNIDNQYVVGYGLDLKQIFRGLPGIYAINSEIENN
jgi:hypoxanthine phosphoribosyltransferase